MFTKFATVVVAVVAMVAGLFVSQASAAPRAAIGGGSGLVINGHFSCTLTTVGRDRSGALVGLTAGHCGNVGNPVVAQQFRGHGVIGRFVAKNAKLDYAVIALDPGKVTPVRRVGGTTITHVGAPVSFPALICKEGRTTGHTCGWAYGDVFASNQTWSQMCIAEGDSGGPVTSGTALVGMVNAYLAQACIGPAVGTNMNTIMGDLNRRGGAGAGFRPI
jgi:hypothetical protein